VVGALLGAVLGALAANAAVAADPAPGRDLDAVRDRLEALRRDLRDAEGTRDAVSDRLRDAEQALSEAQRRAHELARERERARRDVSNVADRARRARDAGAAQRRQLEAMLAREYLRGTPSALALWLAGDDPRDAARRAVYLGYVARARQATVVRVRQDLAGLDALAAEAATRQERVDAIAREEAAQKTRLERERANQRDVLASVADAIAAQRRELSRLQRDEARLTRLVERLAKLAPATRPKADRTALSKPAAAPEPDVPAGAAAASPAPTRPASRARLPVVGELVSRFGSPPTVSGISGKGVFIRAAAGSEVHAIAAGQVVFADWMRGFGNLVILDHGDGRLSLYANNEAIFATLGAYVAAGGVIATVGSSGGAEQPGLYFETRHRGRPFDPLTWAARR
jgi:septal ring factor EnvC (AmiA/AmiB activator)